VRGAFSFQRPRHWQCGPVVGLDSAEIGKRDETKFFDARNSAETEVPYNSSLLAPLVGLVLNLIDFEPRLALAGAFVGTP
jgi:hypothetical protein